MVTASKTNMIYAQDRRIGLFIYKKIPLPLRSGIFVIWIY
nr:MAG TPA: hypothetical protein [Caudoviricetes sp.]